LRGCLATVRELSDKQRGVDAVRSALDTIQSNLADRPMSDAEAEDFQRALALPPSRLEVSPAATKNGS
jgi:hypothetical protein